MKNERNDKMKKLFAIRYCLFAAIALAMAGCRVVEVENRGEGFLTDKDGQPVLVNGQPVKYAKGWNVYHNQHWMTTEADNLEAHIKPEDISFSMAKINTKPSEELGKLVETSLKGAAELASKIGAAIATSGGSVAGDAAYSAIKSAVSSYISKGGSVENATVTCEGGNCTITDGTVTETCTNCVAK